MQQVEATKVEPVYVAPAQKFRSFLLSIWTTIQTTPNDIKLEINILECFLFYFLYLCSAYVPEVVTICLIVLDLEYFVASRQRHFFV